MSSPEARRRIISLSIVKNEQDIIEPFIRHNAQFCDHMVIVDNASLDETRRIVLDCARELGTIVVGDIGEFGYFQAERTTRVLQYCQGAFFADFVLLLDADEFLSAPDRAALLSALESIPPGGVGHMLWRTFVVKPGEEERASKDPPRSFGWRRSKEMPAFSKVVLRLDGEYRPDLSVSQGNHRVFSNAHIVPEMQLPGLLLLHFPVRSANQIAAKVVVGWMAYLAKNPEARRSSEGIQWRDAFDRVANGDFGALASQLAEISIRYAQDRVLIDWDTDVMPEQPPANYERRYSTGAFTEPLSLVARSWERSLVPSSPAVKLERSAFTTTKAGATKTSFDAAWHWDHLFLDVAPFRFIAEKDRPAHVLDIGCGIGAYLALFKNLGVSKVFGVDGVPIEATVGVLGAGEYAVHDLSQPLELGRRFDLVVCVEVVEHLEPQHSDTLLDSIARHAGRTIIFSAAEPGQPGHGHINCQPIIYWLEKWARLGWFPDMTDSLGCRALATMSWFRRNLIVLRRGGSTADHEAAVAALAEIAAKPYAWYGQRPGIRNEPFTEPIPGPAEGYSSAAARYPPTRNPESGPD